MKHLLIALISLSALWTEAAPSPSELQVYRELTLKIRSQASFRIPMPSNGDMHYDYKLEFGEPIYAQPLVTDVHTDYQKPDRFTRTFYDRIWLKDGSTLRIGGEQVPLTCVFVSGQDNRFSGNTSPTFPQFIMRIYIVANDYACKGPMRPGWPRSGGRPENWDTYAHYEIRDPTIMLPVENRLRYRWNEYVSILEK